MVTNNYHVLTRSNTLTIAPLTARAGGVNTSEYFKIFGGVVATLTK